MDDIHELRMEIQELNDGGDYRYMGTSPDLPNLTVVGDTIEEVISLAPGVARALIETMREYGQPVPYLLQQNSLCIRASWCQHEVRGVNEARLPGLRMTEVM